MLILFGEKIIEKICQEGQFQCPDCGCERDFKLIRIRNFFTLFFIPLIPFEEQGHYVECQHCKTSFHPLIIDHYQQYNDAPYRLALLRILGQVLIDRGHTQQNQEILQSIYEQFTHQHASDHNIQQHIEDIKAGQSVINYLKSMTKTINDTGRIKIIQGAYKMFAQTGSLNDDHIRIIESIGLAFGIGYNHTNAIINDIVKK